MKLPQILKYTFNKNLMHPFIHTDTFEWWALKLIPSESRFLRKFEKYAFNFAKV